MTEYIQGTRPRGDRPRERQLSMDYLQQSSKASNLLAELWRRAPQEGAPCVGRAEWTADELPTDREAALMCSPCKIRDLCLDYAKEAHVSFGVWGGTVRGRNLLAAMGGIDDD